MLIRSVFQNSIIKSDLFYNQIKCFSQSLDSCAWKKRHINDEYVKKARYENYRARSAFKLLELDTKHDLIRPGQVVIDLGASPGSWTQAATRLMGLSQDFTKVQRVKANNETIRLGFVVAIDILPIAPIVGAVTLGGVDFTNRLNQSRILSVLADRRANLVMSDMAPNATGTAELDHERIVELAIGALQFATQVLRPGDGHFLCKLWDGQHISRLQQHLLPRLFRQVHLVKPAASREHSAELFLVAKHFKGLNH